MTNRAKAIAPRVVLAGMVAGAAAVTLHFHPASAAEDCLSKPKGTAPAGQHWYYRPERGTKRQCWYLADQASHGASLNARKTAATHHHQQQEALSQSTADAHAELASPAAPTPEPKRDSIVAAVATTPAEPAPMMAAAGPATMPALAADSSAATAQTADSAAGQSSVASRWPDATNATQPVPTPTGNSTSVTVAAADQAATPLTSVDSSTASAATELSATDTDSPGVTTASSGIDSSRTRLAAFLGAVALAGFSTSVLLARARARRRIRLEPAGARRRQIWPADADIDTMQLPDPTDLRPAFLARGEAAPRHAAPLSIVPADDARYDEQYQVEDLLARYGGPGRTRQ